MQPINPRFIQARRRAVHPGYVRAVESKPDTPAEVYAYPAAARRAAAKQWRAPKVPPAPSAPEPTPSTRWLAPAYAIVLLAVWAAAANVTPGL